MTELTYIILHAILYFNKMMILWLWLMEKCVARQKITHAFSFPQFLDTTLCLRPLRLFQITTDVVHYSLHTNSVSSYWHVMSHNHDMDWPGDRRLYLGYICREGLLITRSSKLLNFFVCLFLASKCITMYYK